MTSGVLDERATIGTLFSTAWGNTTPIAWPNRDFDPPAGSWVRLTIIGSDAFPLEVGPNRHERRTGVVIVQVFTTPGKGDAAALQLADQVAGIFRAAPRLDAGDSGDIRFRSPKIRAVGLDGAGAFYQVNVEVPFLHDAVAMA